MGEGELPPVSDSARKHRVGTARRLDALPAIVATVVLLAPLVLAWLPQGAPTTPGEGAGAEIRWTAFGASLAVAACAALLAVVVGGALAGLLVLTDFPGRPFWATVALVPFVCPSMVWALGQVYCYGPGGLMERWCGGTWRAFQAWSDPGHYLVTTLVLAQVHAPLAMLIVGRGLVRLHRAGLDSARLLLAPGAMIRWTIGAVRPEATAAFLLCLALALGNFGVPHVLQCRLYTMEIYERTVNYLDHVGAMRMGLPLVAVAVLATAGMALAERRARYATAEPSSAPAPIRLGWKCYLAGGVLGLYVVASGLLPVAAVVYECQSPGHFLEAVSEAAVETRNSLGIGAAAAGVALVAGLAVGVWAATRARPAVDVLAIVPLGIPPLLLGLAYLRFYNRSWPVNLAVVGNTSALVILALAARGWPFVTRAAAAGRRRIAPEWLEAARLGRVGVPARFRRISLPLLADHVAVGAIVAFILAVGDVQITQMLCAPGTGTLALRLFTFLHFGPAHVAAALALLQLSLSTVPLLVYFLVTNRWLQVV